jgi:hypothetical protein
MVNPEPQRRQSRIFLVTERNARASVAANALETRFAPLAKPTHQLGRRREPHVAGFQLSD